MWMLTHFNEEEIHRSLFYPIGYAKLSTFETGNKVVYLLAPYHRGGKIRLFGGVGVGKMVLIMELFNNIVVF